MSSVKSNLVAKALETISADSPSLTRIVSYWFSPRSIVTFISSRLVKKPEVLVGASNEVETYSEGGGRGLAFARDPRSSFEL